MKKGATHNHTKMEISITNNKMRKVFTNIRGHIITIFFEDAPVNSFTIQYNYQTQKNWTLFTEAGTKKIKIMYLN